MKEKGKIPKASDIAENGMQTGLYTAQMILYDKTAPLLSIQK